MIQSNPESTPIGAIARELETALRLSRTDASGDRTMAVYEDFDECFQSRFDYRIWRHAVRPYFTKRDEAALVSTSLSSGWTDWATIDLIEIKPADPVVTWSLIAFAPEIIEHELQQPSVSHQRLFGYVDQLSALLSGLAPLSVCQSSCGIAAALFLLGRQYLYYRCSRDFDLAGCDELFRSLRGWLRVADPNWQPGRKLNLDRLGVEAKSPERLRPGHAAHEYSLLAEALGRIRPMLAGKIHTLDAVSEQLLRSAYEFSLSAWLTARSRRIDETQYQAQWGATIRGKNKISKAFLLEFNSHLHVADAARDAGEFLESAKHLYLLLRLIPDEFVAHPFVKAELAKRSIIFRYIKETGLEIDPRFTTDERAPSILASRESARQWHENLWRMTSFFVTLEPASLAGQTPVGEAIPETGFALRVRRDLASLPEWKSITEEIPRSASDSSVDYLLRIVRGLADFNLAATPRALSAGLQLALRYGYVRSAGKILTRGVDGGEFEILPGQIVDFVHSVGRCTQLDPFGVEQDRWEEWQRLIRDGCQILADRFGSEWVPAHDRIWIHETLINRTHVHHKGLPPAAAQRLFEKSMGLHDVQDLRAFLDLDYQFTKHAEGVPNRNKIAVRLSEYSRSPLGAPVAISLLSLPDHLSILGVGRSGRIIGESCHEPTLLADIAALTKEMDFWFKIETADPSSEIPWPASLRRVASRVVEVARACDPKPQVVLLSMDTALAHLPWQHLLNVDGGLTDLLVALIPSLSAFTLAHHVPESPAPLKTILSTADSQEIAAVAKSVRDSVTVLDPDRADVCFLVGHGSPPPAGGLPGVCLGPDHVVASLDQWLDIAGSRVSVFHCCHSGTPRPVFMEEFGGVAGLAICLGARVVIAPIAEVQSTTAIALQEQLFEDPTRELGLSYLEAIRADPSCCLYSLYGNPYEQLVPTERSDGLAEHVDGLVTVKDADALRLNGRDERRIQKLMPRYWIKVARSVQNYFPGGAPEDWERQTFDDVTWGGTQLRWVDKSVPGNPKAVLVGQRFQVEVVPFNSRDDALYIRTIKPKWTLNGQASVIDCDLRFVEGYPDEQLDNAANLFARKSANPQLEIQPVIASAPAEPEGSPQASSDEWILRLMTHTGSRLTEALAGLAAFVGNPPAVAQEAGSVGGYRFVVETVSDWAEELDLRLKELPTGDELQSIRDAFGRIRSGAGDTVADSVIARFAEYSVAEVLAETTAIERAIAFFKHEVGGLDGIGMPAILARAVRERESRQLRISARGA